MVPAYDVVATGGVDDLVKVFAYEDGELRLRHKLGDHSLGVVSVALSKEAKYLGRAQTDPIRFAFLCSRLLHCNLGLSCNHMRISKVLEPSWLMMVLDISKVTSQACNQAVF